MTGVEKSARVLCELVGTASDKAVHGIREIPQSSVQQQDGSIWQHLIAAFSSAVVLS